MPRPLVLLGACESEVQKGLVEQGVIEGLKFAFCLRGKSYLALSAPTDLYLRLVHMRHMQMQE